MKTPLRYAGGKSKAYKYILPYIPFFPKPKRIISPFFGGGSMEIRWATEKGIPVIGYDIFNVGTGKEIEILKVVNLIKNQFPNANYLIGEKPYRIGEAMNFYLSINKIKNEIGWVPKWDLEDGINETVKWWLENIDLWMSHKNLLA